MYRLANVSLACNPSPLRCGGDLRYIRLPLKTYGTNGERERTRDPVKLDERCARRKNIPRFIPGCSARGC